MTGIMENVSILGALHLSCVLAPDSKVRVRVRIYGIIFSCVRVRDMVRAITTYYVYVFYEKNHSLISFSLCYGCQKLPPGKVVFSRVAHVQTHMSC